MRWISAILTSILVTAGYYGMLLAFHKKYELRLKRQDSKDTDRVILAIGAVTLWGTVALAYIRLPEFSLPQYVLTMALFSGMAALSVMDIRRHLIPNRMLAILALFWVTIGGVYLILDIENGSALFFRSLTGALAGGFIFLLCYLLSKGQLGAGDVKLAFVLGLYLTGDRIIGGIFYGAVVCCIYSVAQLIRKKLTLKDGVPMAPFLYAGVFITLLIM